MKGTMEKQEKNSLICSDYMEANRLISIMHDEICMHAQGKRFWMWMFLAQVFVAPILEDFFSGFWKGIFG